MAWKWGISYWNKSWENKERQELWKRLNAQNLPILPQ